MIFFHLCKLHIFLVITLNVVLVYSIVDMSIPTPPNLVMNIHNLDVIKEGVVWIYDEDLNKFKGLVESCNARPYKYHNHLRAHLHFKYRLFMEWPKGKHLQKPNIRPWKNDHHKYNVIVMSDEIRKNGKKLWKPKRDRRKPRANGMPWHNPMCICGDG